MINYISRNSLHFPYLNGYVFDRVFFTKNAKKFSLCQCPNYFRLPKITSNSPKATRQNVYRYSSSESGPPSNKLPPLMEFPKITWPSVIKSIRNFILATFIIRPYFDRDFNLPDFVIGSKKAVEVCNVQWYGWMKLLC